MTAFMYRRDDEANLAQQLARLQERDVIVNAVLRPLTLKAIGYARDRSDAIDWPCSGDDLARAKMLAKLDELTDDALDLSDVTDLINALDEPHRTAMHDLNNRRVWL